MRAPILPENFRNAQQDTLSALLDDLYEEAPQIGVVIGPDGTGKTHALRQYLREVEERHKARIDRRRVITLFDARQRFRADGLLRRREDLRWLDDQWKGLDGCERASERELVIMLRSRGHELGLSEEQLPPIPPEETRPCPRPVIVTPSQTTTESGMVKLMTAVVSPRARHFLSVFDANRELMDILHRNHQMFLIVDEAQRLKTGPLTVIREVYDDAGVSVALVGTADLEANLHRRGAESLLSRVSLSYRMEPLDGEQVRALLASWNERLVRRIYAHTGGVFRRIVHLVELAEQIREVNGEPKVTAEILDEVILHVPDLLPGLPGRREVLGVPTPAAPANAMPARTPPVAVAAEARMPEVRQARA